MNIFTDGLRDAMIAGFFFYLLDRGTDFVFGRRILNGFTRPGIYSMLRYGFFLLIEVFWVSWTVFQAYLEHGHRGFTNGFLFATMLFSLPLWLIAIRNNLVSLRDGVGIFQAFRQLERQLNKKRTLLAELTEILEHSERQLTHTSLQLSLSEETSEESLAVFKELKFLGAPNIDLQAKEELFEAEKAEIIFQRQQNDTALKKLKIDQSSLVMDVRNTEKEFKDFVQTLIDNEKKERKGFMGW